MANELQYDATLVERRDLSPELATFRVRLDDPRTEKHWHQGGQYLVVGLNNAQRPELGSVTRPFSLASAAHSGSDVEFFVRLATHPTTANPLTPLLWKLQPGDRLHATAHAAGRFTLRDTVGEHCPQRKILIASGTGLAPFISMLRDRLGQTSRPDLRDFVLIRGVEVSREFAFEEQIAQWVEDAGLIDLPCVSRPDLCPDWSGHKGRVHDFFSSDRIGELCKKLDLHKIDPSNARVLICGASSTVASCVKRLLPLGFIPDSRAITKALGLPRNVESHLYFEQYDDQPLFDLQDQDAIAKLRDLLPPKAA